MTLKQSLQHFFLNKNILPSSWQQLIIHLMKKKVLSLSHQMIEYGNILEWPPWAERLTRLNHVMLVTNSSANIVIYVFQVSKDFLKSLCRCLQQKLSGLQIPPRLVGAHHVLDNIFEGGWKKKQARL